MPDIRPERPLFTEGQYIGAADLTAIVGYERDDKRRLMLSGNAWGIAVGLALIERVTAAGAVELYIEPGLAWDGYGRPIVVLSPVQVTPDLFASLPSGNQNVWLRYDETQTSGVAPGFQTCNATDPFVRVQENYVIVAGPMTAVTDRTDGITIGGAAVADPRNMLIAVDQNAPVVLDGSAPQQTFPADSAHWLVPIGIASWQAGSPGTFQARTSTQLLVSGTVRRYLGVIGEDVLAAAGVLRLRDRETLPQAGKTNDDLEAAAAIQLTDLQFDQTTGRITANELVWVEGNMRVIGDARLFGGALSFRASHGTEPEGSFFLRRNVDATTKTTQNLEVSIGQPPSGVGTVNRLLVAASQNGTLATPPALSVGTDARVGIGVAVPATGLALDVNGDFGHNSGPTTLHLNGSTVGDTNGTLLLTAGGGTIELGADGVVTHIAIGTSSPQADTALDVHGGGIAVNNKNAFLRLLGSALIDQDDGVLRIRSGGSTVAFDGADNVGIGTFTPAKLLDVAGDANVSGTLIAGNVGIGTTAPRSVLEADRSAPGGLGPVLTLTNLGGGVNAAAAIDFNTFPPSSQGSYNPSSRIEAVDDGGWANDIVFLSNNPGSPNNGLTERFRITSQGSVGIGTSAPGFKLDVTDRIRLRQGPSGTAGLWLFQTAPNQDRAFIGMAGDSQVGLWGNTGATWGLVMDTGTGNVGIGIGATSPAAKLDVGGSVHASGFPTSSDRRFKANMAPITEALQKIESINGVIFDWNELYQSLGRSTGRREIGVIAQDVEKVFPELVSTWHEEEYRAVDYGRLAAVLVEGIKELKVKNEALERRIATLEDSLNERNGRAPREAAGPRSRSREGSKPK